MVYFLGLLLRFYVLGCIFSTGEKQKDMYIISETESNRIRRIRAALIVGIVICHSYSVGFQFMSGNIDFDVPLWVDVIKHFISREIAATCVPMFFLISSILLYRKPIVRRENIRKKVKQLLIPYLFFNALWIIGFYVLQLIPAFRNYFPDSSTVISEWTFYNWLDAFLGLDGYPMLYPLWFLRDLFILNLAAIPLKKLVERFPKALLALFALVWIFIPERDGCFRESLQSICFWGFGCCLVCMDIHIFSLPDRFPKILYLIVYSLLAVADELVFRFFPGTELFCIIHRLGLIAGVGFWGGFFGHLDFSSRAQKILFCLSSYSFNIYLLHENFLTALKKVCAVFLPVTPFWLLLEFFVLPIVIILFCILLSKLIRKFFPQVYSFAFGGK